MPKLLTIDRKLRTLSRRIVTDAGGAPCCCTPGDSCPCDPALRLAAFRAETCVGGRRGGVEASGPARIAIVRLQWAIAWETYSESLRGYPNFAALAQRGASTGTAQWCVLHSTTGQNDLIWILSGATSVLEIQTAGTSPRLPADASLNLVGADALLYPVPGLPRFPATDYLTETWATWALDSQVRQRVSFVNVPTIGRLDHDAALCRGTSSESSPGSSASYEWAFGGDVGGGFQTKRYESQSSSEAPFNGVSRQVTDIAAAWTIRYLTCETGGPDQLRPEGGCSNCGDRATLEAWA